MLDDARLLIAAIFIPFAGAALLWVLAPAGRHAVRVAALVVTLLTLLIAGLVVRNYVGEYCTSLEMAGASLTILRLDAELEALLDAPAETAARIL